MTNRVLIYCRESRDDGCENYERIEVQRDILINYCKRQNLGSIQKIIMDDNISGTNEERLFRLRTIIKKEEINRILIKDSSRLSRNLKASLDFIAFLEQHDVSLYFESEAYHEDLFPLYAWYNEMRAKEDSRKIRRTLGYKKEQGELMIKAPFGYYKKHGRLLIDWESRLIIKEIFELYAGGVDIFNLVSYLNQKQYKTPSQLNPNGGLSISLNWETRHVQKILGSPIYCGFRPDDRKKNKNQHEGIIDEHLYGLAADRRKGQRSVKKKKHPFSGILTCGKCHSTLYYHNHQYICHKYHNEGKKGCDPHQVSPLLLEEKLQDYVKLLADYYWDSPFLKDIIKRMIEEDCIFIKQAEDVLMLIYKDCSLENIDYGVIDEKVKYLNHLKDICMKRRDFNSQELTKEQFNLILYEFARENINAFFERIIVFNQGEIALDDEIKERIHRQTVDDIDKKGGLLFILHFDPFDMENEAGKLPASKLT